MISPASGSAANPDQPAARAASADHPAGPAEHLAARAENLVKRYGAGEAAVTALNGVSIEIAAGSFTAVMGPSGCGKSTLLHCMAGLDTADAGQAWIGGEEISSMPDRQLTRLRRDRVGFIFQAFNLLPVLSAAGNITLPLDIAGRRPDPDWLATVVETVGLADRLGHRPSELSGGQQQRVAIARALVSRPAVVFADEPTGNLDSRAGAGVLDLLRQCVAGYGQTVIMVTHDPVAASYAQQVVFMADGRIVGTLAHPSPETVLDRMRALGEPVPHPVRQPDPMPPDPMPPDPVPPDPVPTGPVSRPAAG